MLKNHNVAPDALFQHIRYEERPCHDERGQPIQDLHNVWIILDNPKQLNAYTTEAIKDVILAFQRAGHDRAAVAVIFTGTGDRAFCTGGNTKEYAEYYAGRPEEYRQYMRLFNDMVTAILLCDKPTINRVNGLRIAGGQEIGMACDFSIASDLAQFGQAGPRHGSAPDGGATDFLHLFVGIGHALESLTLCEPWSAYKALRLGLINQAVPVLRMGARYAPNPLVITDRWVDASGRIVYGEFRTGEERQLAQAYQATATVDLAPLDEAVEALCTKLLLVMPGCLMKTIGSVRKKKLEHWDRNRESNREWLGLNMMTEGQAGFRAFNEGPKGQREVDFVELRRRLASGEAWSEELIRAIMPPVAASTGREGR